MAQEFGLLLLACLFACAFAQAEKPGLPKDRPLVIAHRGASGELPEHTKEAYLLGIEQGADFIECDVTVTKDRVLICRHEPNLADTTDALEKFPEMMTNYTIDGDEVEGIFSVDLTLEEVKTLKAKQTRDFRDPNFDGMFDVPTLEEYIDIALNASRVIGIYPETKHPTWTNGLKIMKGTTMEELLVDVLLSKGYGGDINSDTWAKQPVFIQSFEVGNLKFLSGITDMPLVQLLGGFSGFVTPDNGKTHEEMTTDESLKDIATYSVGVGPWKGALLPQDDKGYIGESTGLTRRLKDLGMQVHPYTFRNEDRFLSWTWGQDFRNEYRAFFDDECIDGAFTDFPGSLAEFFRTQD